jgi:TRAP-type C4-dicarboxylate transport system permease small subunit
MKKWTLIWVGFVAGLAFAGWSLFQEPRPAFCVFLQAPLTWFFNYADNLHIFHRESLAGLAFVIPMWFIYWACLGAVTGFLVRLLFHLFRRLKRHDTAAQPRHDQH